MLKTILIAAALAVPSAAIAQCSHPECGPAGCFRHRQEPRRTIPYDPQNAPKFEFPDDEKEEPEKDPPKISRRDRLFDGNFDLDIALILAAAAAGIYAGYEGAKAEDAEDTEAGRDPDTDGDEDIEIEDEDLDDEDDE